MSFYFSFSYLIIPNPPHQGYMIRRWLKSRDCVRHSGRGLSIRKWQKSFSHYIFTKSESHQKSLSHIATPMVVLYIKLEFEQANLEWKGPIETPTLQGFFTKWLWEKALNALEFSNWKTLPPMNFIAPPQHLLRSLDSSRQARLANELHWSGHLKPWNFINVCCSLLFVVDKKYLLIRVIILAVNKQRDVLSILSIK